MKGNVYAMITSRSSDMYTGIAIDSFFRSTQLTNDDIFYLIDNDNMGTRSGKNITVIANPHPQSFSKNVNDIINLADGRDIFVLSNDVVFTPRWNDAFHHYTNVILLPSCNQTHVYDNDLLTVQPTMTISDYNNQYTVLAEISRFHKQVVPTGFSERLLMPFYVFRLPAAVYTKLGLFDETFGIGGGEDVDYRLRAIRNGISVKYVNQSYLLHFQGKSTWDGAETKADTATRNTEYRSVFSQKWGDELAELCLHGGDFVSIIDKYNLRNLISTQDFSRMITAVLNTTIYRRTNT